MSKNKLPEQTNPEEVDLGLMFGYIEKVFRKLGIFIKNIFIIVLWTLKKLLLLLLFSFKIIILTRKGSYVSQIQSLARLRLLSPGTMNDFFRMNSSVTISIYHISPRTKISSYSHIKSSM